MNRNSFRLLRGRLIRELTASLMSALILLQSVQAAAPDWWSERNVINLQKIADDYVALNQGQLKLLASRAWLQMELSLPGGAGPDLTQMISGWRLVLPQTDDFAAVNVGQMKQVTRLFYERLADAGLAPLPGWLSQPGEAGADDYALANLGQAKALFSFAIPQALGAAPQRLSGNGLSGPSLLPSGYAWGTGRPPFTDASGLESPGMLPGNDEEVSTNPQSPVDWSSVAASQLVVDFTGAYGAVSKTRQYVEDGEGNWVLGEDWDWDGIAHTYGLSDSATGFESEDDMLHALGTLISSATDPSSTFTQQGDWGSRPSFNIGSRSDVLLMDLDDEGEGDEEVVWASWQAEEVHAKAYYSGGQPGGPPLDAWWEVKREVYDEEGQIVTRQIVYQPCSIASSRDSAAASSFVSNCWDVPGQSEGVWIQLVLPTILQVNDGDADGDGIPDFADGQSPAYPDPEDEPDLPETAPLKPIDYFGGEKVRFHYTASDPAAVTSTAHSDGTTDYQPAEGSLRLWRTKIFESYAVNRNPASVIDDGDFIPSDVWLDAADLGGVHCESVALSQQNHDQTLEVEVDPDGDGPEPSYLYKKYFFTSVGMHLERIENGQIGERDRRMQPSLPNPTIDVQSFSVTNARVADDGSGLLADIVFTGTVRSTVCDLTPGEETGAIHQAYASVNSEPLPQSVVSLQMSKTDTPGGQDRPYPYEGTFNHTLTGVKVTEGKNTLGLIVSDPLYHLSGTAEVGFEIEATPPGGAGGAYASSTEVLLELPVAGGTLAADEARLSISVDDEPLVDNVILKRQSGGLLYRSADGQAAFQFSQAPTLTDSTAEVVHGFVTLPQAGWQSAAFSPMRETDVNSGTFTWSAQEEYAGYWGWSAAVGQVDEAVESGAGNFHAYTIRLAGPMDLLTQIKHVHIGGQALPVLIQNGIARVADMLHPNRPATVAALPIKAVQSPEHYSETSMSEELAALGPDASWNQLDVPEDEHDPLEAVMSRRLAQDANQETGPDFVARIKRQAGVWWDDHTDFGFYQGFVAGFLDNPYSTGQAAIETLVGIGQTAIDVQVAIVHYGTPLGMAWEFAFGDCYEGNIKAATQAARGAKEAVDMTYQALKEWGPQVIEFLWKLNFQANAAVLDTAFTGEIPAKEKLGPELQLALDVIINLAIMADDAWVGMEPYERGYWQGYIFFEVVIVVVAAVLTTPDGCAGAAAMLARHAPKLTRIMGYIEKLLTKFDDVPKLRNVTDKIRAFLGIARNVTREMIMTKLDDLVDTSIIRNLDPSAKVGYRGSLPSGFKYDKKARRLSDKPFDPKDFDIDAFIVSDELAELAESLGADPGWRDARFIPKIGKLQNKLRGILRKTPEFQGLKPGRDGDFTFRIYTEAKWISNYGKTEHRFFSK